MASSQVASPQRINSNRAKNSSSSGFRGWGTSSFILVAIPLVIFLAVTFMIFSSLEHDQPIEKFTSLRGAKNFFRSIQSMIPILDTNSHPIALTTPKTILPTHLIVVPGHAAMHIEKLSIAEHSDDAWYLLSYQKNQGYPHIISSHILKSLELLTNDSTALLLFSGGETRHDVGPLSEAASYYYLAEYQHWIHSKNKEKIYLEEFARDSFENLLFSICRFHEITNYYPSKITIVGFDFKAKRYTDLHRKAIYYPEENFTYLAIHSSFPFNQEQAEDGEKHAYEEFSKDLYGCNDHVLHEKRIVRNPFHRSIPYELSCPDLKVLLEWCASELIDKKFIPWLSDQNVVVSSNVL